MQWRVLTLSTGSIMQSPVRCPFPTATAPATITGGLAAGFGMPMAASTVLLPFYEGAAVLAILFPLFILIACDTDPDQGGLGMSGTLGRRGDWGP